ncbi:Secreted and transmembrane protein 1A, partial [Galemys pyrenaicus]
EPPPVRDQDPGCLPRGTHGPACPLAALDPPAPGPHPELSAGRPGSGRPVPQPGLSPSPVWDRTTCTEGMVTVPRGQRALMSCTSSSPFTHVEIRLRVPGKPTQLIFRVDTPGSFSSAGWRLVVQGGEAQLVIQDAQPGQVGEYAWVLTGRQRMTKNTRLELSAWDRTTCTKGVVTVPRGQRALMSCTSSSPFTHLIIYLRVPGKAAQLIFRVDAPGDFSHAGWRLVVRGGEAQLVIQDAQPGQAGEYTWVLAGPQWNTRNTSTEASAPGPAPPALPSHIWGLCPAKPKALDRPL